MTEWGLDMAMGLQVEKYLSEGDREGFMIRSKNRTAYMAKHCISDWR